jgi:hypothetical protein
VKPGGLPLCRLTDDKAHFLDLPFYETGTVKKNPVGPADVKIIKDLLLNIKPHQIYAAGDFLIRMVRTGFALMPFSWLWRN